MNSMTPFFSALWGRTSRCLLRASLGGWAAIAWPMTPAIAQVSAPPPLVPAALTSQLTLVVDGLRDQTGQLCWKVFTGSQGFPHDNNQAINRDCVALDPEATDPFQVTFSDLTPGSYAIAVYHDRNSDQVLNRGAFGMPLEGYGFSNDPRVNTGPPAYRDAVFLLVSPAQTVTIQLRYP